MRKSTLTLVAGLLFGAVTAQAATSSPRAASGLNNNYIGGLLGVSSGNMGIGSGFAFGLNAAHYFDQQNYGLGAFFRGANHDLNLSTFTVGAEGLYRLADLIPGLQFGVHLGTLKLSGNADGTTSFMYGAKVALDFPVSSDYPITVGADLSLDRASISATTAGNAPTETYTFFSPMLTGKFWF